MTGTTADGSAADPDERTAAPDEPAADPTPPSGARSPSSVAHVSTSAAGPGLEPIAGDLRLPGEHRGGFSRLPTAPIDVTVDRAPETEPFDGDADAADLAPDAPVEGWRPPQDSDGAEPARPPRVLHRAALGVAVPALLISLVVGWGMPLGILGIVLAALSLRRPGESRVIAGWALALSILSVLYSVGWLTWALLRATHVI